MKNRNLALVLIALLTSGCGVSGNYRGSGPCEGFHRNPPACERASQNARAAGKVQVGQTLAAVLSAMGHDPERREASTDSETWWYLTDYQTRTYALFIFKDGVVAEIKQSSGR